jgi:hypothetical protein
LKALASVKRHKSWWLLFGKASNSDRLNLSIVYINLFFLQKEEEHCIKLKVLTPSSKVEVRNSNSQKKEVLN